MHQERKITFEKQTPRLYLPREYAEFLYEKGLLRTPCGEEGEYTRDTTTWD